MPNVEIIFLPGLFEKTSRGFLSASLSDFISRGYPVHECGYFPGIDNPNIKKSNGYKKSFLSFQEIEQHLKGKIRMIKKRGHKAVLVSHSLGAFIALWAGREADLIITFDASTHPKDMFKNIVCHSKKCSWAGSNKYLNETLVQSASKLPNMSEVLKVSKAKIVFIGAKLAGAVISKDYHSIAGDKSTYLEQDCNHEFSGKNTWATTKISELITSLTSSP